MQLPGLDQLESSVARAVERMKRLSAENVELSGRLQAVGKEIDELGVLISSIEAGQKMDSKTRKRVGQRLKSIVDKIG
ncbi:MAG: cell division protein ZapB [Candidatus Eisenbacteria bacterium]|nr:cell division protein ZapB [Candidatus Eisenbacteria bacterium]